MKLDMKRELTELHDTNQKLGKEKQRELDKMDEHFLARVTHYPMFPVPFGSHGASLQP